MSSPNFVSLADAVRRLGKSEAEVLRLVAEGALQADVRFDPEELERFLTAGGRSGVVNEYVKSEPERPI